ncbi:BA14K family protein [Nitratireductor basaltis]|uniref:Lectin-like protein BA14k n=1 Tax=Nitratireductor basaltis TaxID=472175 RepID=A0A084U9W5_9HYPH|nr:BA14K family protein [Nitratireductor basaltis]KFB09751.1 BA14K-like protein [Nitratireductor basaltis]
MKSIFSAMAVAGFLSIGMAATPAGASALGVVSQPVKTAESGETLVQKVHDTRRKHRHARRHHNRKHWRRHHSRPRAGIYFEFGTPGYSRPYYDRPYYARPRYVRPAPRVRLTRAHVNWCHNRYRSYRTADNTFQPYNGPRRQCRSPYWPR